MNIFPTRKEGVPPKEVEKMSLESEEYNLDYDFRRLKKVDKDAKDIIDTMRKEVKKI